MDELGVKITGYFTGSDSKIQEFDGVKRVSYRYLLVAGMDSFVVASDDDYTGTIQMHDLVTFIVNPRVFGGKVFYSRGRLVL